MDILTFVTILFVVLALAALTAAAESRDGFTGLDGGDAGRSTRALRRAGSCFTSTGTLRRTSHASACGKPRRSHSRGARRSSTPRSGVHIRRHGGVRGRPRQRPGAPLRGP